ncbi:hypothetical protein UlMin_022260 [Ulmus minor]
MENSKFKLKLSRMFRSSFGSCRTRNLSDVIEKAVVSPQTDTQSFHMIDPPVSPKIRPFSNICRPNWSESTQSIDNNCIMSTMDVMLPRRKVSEKCSPFFKSNGRTCPPASPVFPLNPFYELRNNNLKQKKKKPSTKKKTQMKKINFNKKEFVPLSSSSQDSNLGNSWFSSEEDDEREEETDAFFTSRSLSSDSSELRRRHRSHRKDHGCRRRRASSEVGLFPLEGRVKDSFAVVKKSRDPHNDFRTSMVEMIVEKQIFGAKDLEQLLQCFLSLNSHNHHQIIVEVFTEILEALFSSWGS